MSLTRKMLKGMGLTEEQQETILEAHSETVDGLKAERDRFKTDAESVQRKLDEAQQELDTSKKDSWKVKYDALKEDFDSYKTEQGAKETKAAKEKAYRALLKDVGISDKRIEAVLRVSDVDGVELDDKGAIKGVDDLKKTIKEEWSDFISTTGAKGADDKRPPANTGGGSTKTKEEIMNIKDAAERQKAIMENPALFGIEIN